MREITAYTTLLATVGLSVLRPRVGGGRRLDPALCGAAGVLILLLTGVVRPDDLTWAFESLWRPILGVTAIMQTASVAQRLGVPEWVAGRLEARAAGSTGSLFATVFAVAAVAATALNNDCAVLLLTPLVVALVRRAHPGRPELVMPFAFAVFMAAGVAPLPVSNPMNMIVATYAGIGFNEYAARMLPIALAGSAVGFVALRALFRRELGAAARGVAAGAPRAATPAQRQALALLFGVLLASPVVTSLGGPMWVVALAGAGLATLLAIRHRVGTTADILARGVSWNVLGFLIAALVIARGLGNVGFVGRVADLYAQTGLEGVGAISALGSALLNNHPMALLNLLALEALPGAGHRQVLAALIGGDLGPRLLPTGSLAGILWLESLRRLDVEVPVRTFVFVGAVVTIPTLAVSLLVLRLV